MAAELVCKLVWVELVFVELDADVGCCMDWASTSYFETVAQQGFSVHT